MSSEDREAYEPKKQEFISAIAEYTRQAKEANTKLVNLVDRLLETGVLAREDIQGLGLFTILPYNNGKAVTPGASQKPRKKRPADPDAPKRPLPGYLAYSNQEKKKIKEDMAKEGKQALSMTELNEYVSQKWKELPEDVRENLQKEHEIAIKKYNEEMKQYREKKGETEVPKQEESYDSE